MALRSATDAVRRGTDRDGALVEDVVREVFAEYDGCLFVPEEFPELAAVASHYERRDGALWIAERDGRAVGTFAVFRSAVPASFELAKVYLRREARGRGLAARLLADATRFARERGARRLELFTDTRFLDAHRFYEKHGFRRLPGERCLGDLSDTWEFHYERPLAA